MYRCIFNHIYSIGPATEFGEIMQNTRPLRRSRSFKVTDLVPIDMRFPISD